jgi:hypothetical protein
LLVPVREAVAYLVERWADEDAAATVDDRDLVAQAVARAALAAADSGPVKALGMHSGAAVDRVQALAEPAPAPQRRRLVGPVVLSAGFLATTTVATTEFVIVATAWL